MGMWLIVAALSLIMLVSLARLGKVSETTTDGMLIRTIFRRHLFIPWSNLKSPIRLSRLLWITFVELRFAEPGFLSLRLSITAWVPRSIEREAFLSAIPESFAVSDWSWRRKAHPSR